MLQMKGPESVDTRSPHRHWALFVLALIYGVNYLDRQVLAIVLEPIKQEFQVSDAALGLLAGPTFALFYATLGLPLAWLADRRNRVSVIAASAALFGLMTLLCGMAAHFWNLALARVGTAVGEAGTGPSSQSVIADLYAPEHRAAAQSVYAMGVNAGLMVAFFGGGWIAQHYGWRSAFLAAGVPALLLAAVARLTVTEPPRGKSEHAREPAEAPPSRQVISFLKSQRAYRYIVLGTSMSAFSGYGVTAFLPAFLVRSHSMSLAAVGFSFALILGIGGGIGTVASGVAADRLARRDTRWNLRLPAYCALASLPFWPVFLLAHDTTLAIYAAILPLALSATWMGPCVAMIQGLAPLRMRAQAAAMQLFIGNAIGLGLGPQIVGLASDFLRPYVGMDSLRYALFACVLAQAASIACYRTAARTLKDDLARATAWQPAPRESTC
jgi:predicted MFS family arabinose efflux permease